MDNNKGQTIFLSVIGIATLLVAIIGATFAWFSVTVSGNDNASSIIVTTAVLGSITFEDGDTINLSNIRPEGETGNIATKTFTISNSTSNLSSNIIYTIWLDVTTNTLSALVNTSQGATGTSGDWFTNKIEYTATGSTFLTGDVAAFTGTGSSADFVPVPLVGTNNELTAAHRGTITGVSVHKYTYTIKFKDDNSDQNAAQGKAFLGRLRVTVTSGS